MKKLWCVVLAAFMLTALCGCSGSEPLSGTVSDSGTVSHSDTVPEALGEFSIGQWENNVYTNAFAGITYTEPEDWSHFSNADLLTLMRETSDGLSEEEQAQKLAEINPCYVLDSADSSNSGSVQIIIENMTDAENPSIGEDDYLADAAAMLKANFTICGFDCEVSEAQTVRIGDGDYKSVIITCSSGEVRLIDQMYAVRRIGDHIVSVIITAGVDRTVGSILENIT